jgi:hypothetical protein
MIDDYTFFEAAVQVLPNFVLFVHAEHLVSHKSFSR